MELIGQGMEGAVYDLGDGRVSKTWFDRRPDDVRPLKAFLDELPPLPFRTPRIREIGQQNGQAVTVEDKLTGTPLQDLPQRRTRGHLPAQLADGWTAGRRAARLGFLLDSR